MADNHSKEVRSKNMSAIKSKNTKPELKVRSFLFSKGLRYRINVAKLPGKPDLVFPKYRTVIFVQGCFWHKHDCGRFHWPKSNVEYWEKKINGNVQRDMVNQKHLTDMGWQVLTVWECELKKDKAEQTLERLYQQIIHNKKS